MRDLVTQPNKKEKVQMASQLKQKTSGKHVGYSKANDSKLSMAVKKMKGSRLQAGGGAVKMPASRTVNTSKSSSRSLPRAESAQAKGTFKTAPQPVQFSNRGVGLATKFVN